MPELPEVETVRRQLAHEFSGATIKRVEVRFGKKLSPAPKTFVKEIEDKKILDVERRAKLLIIKLSGGLNMLIHLKMTGRLLLRDKKSEPPNKHAHVIFHLADGRELRWEDWRQFGFIKLEDDAGVAAYIEKQAYGPEPLDPSFSAKKMAMCLRSHPKKKIKPLLLEQSCIAGIGNIYAAEALWYAKIHPLTLVGQTDDAHLKTLYAGLIKVLKGAIKTGGSSADAYIDVYGHQGTFVPNLKVYGREGEPCNRCGTILKNLVIGGRGTIFCPTCQKL